MLQSCGARDIKVFVNAGSLCISVKQPSASKAHAASPVCLFGKPCNHRKTRDLQPGKVRMENTS